MKAENYKSKAQLKFEYDVNSFKIIAWNYLKDRDQTLICFEKPYPVRSPRTAWVLYDGKIGFSKPYSQSIKRFMIAHGQIKY